MNDDSARREKPQISPARIAVWIAVGEMTKRREDIIAAVAANGAEYVTRLACRRIEAFHESKIAIGCGAQQRVEVCTGMIGDSHWSSPDKTTPGA